MCIYIERDRETQGGGSSNGGGWVEAVGETKLTLSVMLNTGVSTTELLGLWTHPQTRWPNLGYDGRQTIEHGATERTRKYYDKKYCDRII